MWSTNAPNAINGSRGCTDNLSMERSHRFGVCELWCEWGYGKYRISTCQLKCFGLSCRYNQFFRYDLSFERLARTQLVEDVAGRFRSGMKSNNSWLRGPLSRAVERSAPTASAGPVRRRRGRAQPRGERISRLPASRCRTKSSAARSPLPAITALAIAVCSPWLVSIRAGLMRNTCVTTRCIRSRS